jgi:serine/threonine protein kinase/tetratricopeptide (TPR) repeat protein
MIGAIISHYEVLEKLGEGGMGVLYRARDLRLGRMVALKALQPEHKLDAGRRARFVLEAKAASALNHPNLVTVYEIATVDGADYIAMELVQGDTLRQRTGTGGLNVSDALSYATQIASGLAAAHAAGIVHRDIKPANIMVTTTGLVKILDFGLAQIQSHPIEESANTWTMPAEAQTRPGTVVGTLAYMSPEQIKGKDVDQRSDIFSFGVVLYQMLTGHLPFRSDSAFGLMSEIVHAPAPSLEDSRSDVPPGLQRILSTALEKDLDRRYATSELLLEDLKQVTREWESGIAARPDSPAASSSTAASPAVASGLRAPVTGKKRWLVAAAAMLIVLGALGWKGVQPWFNTLFSSVPTEKKIAVLPFLNVGGAPENQALCDGVMEALTSELTQLEQFHGSLWVVPSTEVRRERLSSATGARRALGANLVITGSVQRDSSHVHLTASLVDTATLRVLQSHTIRKPFVEFADLQEEVVREIAGMLKVELGSQERQILAAGQTKAGGAYDLYLQAQGYLQRRNIPDLDRAIELFEHAVAQDSNYVLAYAGLGEAYWRKYRATSDRRWVEPAETNCNRALALNGRLAPVYVTLGIVQEGTGHHEEAIRTFQRALELDPINASAYSELGNTYLAMGKLEEAGNTYKKAAQLRPNDFTSMNDLGLFYYGRGRYQEAARIFKRMTELLPDNSSGYTNLGAVNWMDGHYAEAAVSYEKSLALRPSAQAYTSLGAVYFFLDRCPEAVPLMEKASELRPKNDQMWGNLGDVYGCSPNGKERAAQAYRRAVELGEERLAVNPKDAETLGRVALYQARLGEKGAAVEKTKQAVQLAPTNRSVNWHAALTYELAGQRELALESVGAALKAGQPLQEVSQEPALAQLRTDPRYAGLVAVHGGGAGK